MTSSSSDDAATRRERRRIRLRALSTALVVIVLALAYHALTAERLGGGIAWLGFRILLIVTGVAVLALLVAACEFGFASVDAILDWINPAWPGPWFRWPPAARFGAMLVVAIGVALALDSRFAVWLVETLKAAAVAALGDGKDGGLVGAATGWVGARLAELLEPYFGDAPRLRAASFGLLARWAQPMAIAAGLVAVLFRRAAAAARIGNLDAWREPAAGPAPTSSAPARPRKRIIVLCDGTSNSANQKDGDVDAPTNVHRLYTLIERFDPRGLPQVAVYDPGVGTETSRQSVRAKQIRSFAELLGAKKVAKQSQRFGKLRAIWELATGAGILENIEEGYREIVRLYEPGDEIFLLGFSRGAYTARCIAGVISRCGLLTADNIRFVPDVIMLYRRRPPGREGRLVRPSHIHPDVKIRFMGLWDTVASLGLPLWGWWFRLGALWRNQALNNNPAGICTTVCHALSIDETRSQFMPTLTEPSASIADQEIRQVWFRGGHAEVGGGYAEHELADLALAWMTRRAAECGLAINLSRLPRVEPRRHPFAPIRTAIMRNPGWAIFGTWPRWHPAEPEGTDPASAVLRRYGTLDGSVWTRAREAAPAVPPDGGPIVLGERAAADAFVYLRPGQTAIVAVTADRIWNRTGVVVERNAVYEISHVDGQWRDQEKRACGPSGDRLSGLDAPRRVFGWARRRPDAEYVELIGHVAHPRPWPTFEFGFFKMMHYFVFRDPWPLRASLMRIGRGFAEHKRVYVSSTAPAGLFYAFANDLWRTYANNSGSLRIAIRRLAPDEHPTAGAIEFLITERGEALTTTAAGDGTRRLADAHRVIRREGPAEPPASESVWTREEA